MVVIGDKVGAFGAYRVGMEMYGSARRRRNLSCSRLVGGGIASVAGSGPDCGPIPRYYGCRMTERRILREWGTLERIGEQRCRLRSD